MPRTRDEARVNEARRLYGLGLTTYAIAAQLRTDPRTVQRWLGDGIGPRGPRPRPDVRDATVLDLRDRESLSFAEIGRRVHMSTTGARMRYYALTGRERPERAKAPAPIGLGAGHSAAPFLAASPDRLRCCMFWLILCAVVLVVLPVVLRIFAEEGPDGGVVHHSGEDKDSTGDEECVALAARPAA